MSESRVPAAAIAALAFMSGGTAADATSTTVDVPLSQLLANGQSYQGTFDISSLLSNGTNSFQVTSATLQLSGYSEFGQTDTVFTGYYTYAYTAYGVGYYSYSCGWGSTCYAPYSYSYTAYATAPTYAPVDGSMDTLALTSGTDSSSGSDFAFGSPPSYYGSLVAELLLGPASLNSANSTGIINFTGIASTNNDVILKGASLTLTLEQLVSQASSVPEPTTWAMMLVGFGAMGGALRAQRRRAARVVVA
jgi:PEP-CTERM motif